MQTTWFHSFFGSTHPTPEQPSFCPKHARVTTLGPVSKAQETIRSMRTSFSETSLDDVKISLDKHYSHIILNRLDSEFFQIDPPFAFSFDESMFLFLWTIDLFRQWGNNFVDISSINEECKESWRSVLNYAERLYNDFLAVFPTLNQEECKSNIRMIALLISLKFYYCEDEVHDSDFIRAFYLSSTGFEFHKLPEIAKMNIETIETGITCYQLRRMEAIFISAIFKHSQKERLDDSTQSVATAANSKRSFGSSSI